MKILQVNNVYGKGSTGLLTETIHKKLIKNGIKSVVCYGRGKRIKEKDIYKTSSEVEAKLSALMARITGIMYSHSYFATRRLIKIIEKEEPDIVHLQCINGWFVNIFRLIEYLNIYNYKTVLTLHSEFMYTANCGLAQACDRWKIGCGDCPQLKSELHSYFFDRTRDSWNRMRKVFQNMNNIKIISVSPWLDGRVRVAPILKDKKHGVILNGVDTNIFQYIDCKKIKKEFGFKEEKIILYVTARFGDENKGGKYIFELAKRTNFKHFRILIIGSDNIKGEDEYENVVSIGKVERDELPRYYSMADVTVITSKTETFSMPVAESLCCGTPVVGFKAGGPETIALKDYSSFVEFANIDALENEILIMVGKNIPHTEIEKQAKLMYAEENMINCYFNLYDHMVKEDKA